MITPDQTLAPSASQMFEGLIDAELLDGNMTIKIQLRDRREHSILTSVVEKYRRNGWNVQLGSSHGGDWLDYVKLPHGIAIIKFSS